MRRITARFLFIPFCSMFIMAASCHKSAAPVNSANVMFVNGCLNTSPLSVKANSVNVDGASAINFLENSGYVYVNAGNGVNLTFYQAGTPLANRAQSLAAPNHYTAFVGGIAGDPTYTFTTDDLTPPTPGSAKFRFINLSPDNINETATLNDSIVAQGVAPGSISTFFQLRAGKYTVGAFDPTNSSLLIDATDSITFQGGKIYTIMLTGSTANTGANGLTFSVIRSN